MKKIYSLLIVVLLLVGICMPKYCEAKKWYSGEQLGFKYVFPDHQIVSINGNKLVYRYAVTTDDEYKRGKKKVAYFTKKTQYYRGASERLYLQEKNNYHMEKIPYIYKISKKKFISVAAPQIRDKFCEIIIIVKNGKVKKIALDTRYAGWECFRFFFEKVVEKRKLPCGFVVSGSL